MTQIAMITAILVEATVHERVTVEMTFVEMISVETISDEMIFVEILIEIDLEQDLVREIEVVKLINRDLVMNRDQEIMIHVGGILTSRELDIGRDREIGVIGRGLEIGDIGLDLGIEVIGRDLGTGDTGREAMTDIDAVHMGVRDLDAEFLFFTQKVVYFYIYLFFKVDFYVLRLFHSS